MAKPLSNLESRLAQLNAELKVEGFKVAVEARGKRNFLSLVATLPSRPGNKSGKRRQQRISLGHPLSKAALNYAEARARLLGLQILNNSFSWADWIEDKPTELEESGWLERYKAWVLQNKLKKYSPDEKEDLWKRRYLYRGINKLSKDRAPRAEHFISAVLEYDEDLPARFWAAQTLGNLAKFLGVEVDLKTRKGSYKQTDSKERVIPTDDQIIEIISKILNPRWRYVFGMMAAYGLRDHEVFASEIKYRDEIPVCIVADGKTGKREAYPVPTDWVVLFNLQEKNLPPTTASKTVLGDKCSKAWRRQCKRVDISPGWTPYSLRHAYAIRCHLKGVPIAVAAKWLGHSPKTYQEVYSKWIGQSVSEDIWRSIS